MDAVPPAMPAELRPHQAMVQNSRRWMEASDVIPMFPTFVWKVQIEAGLRDAPRERFLAAMTEMRASPARTRHTAMAGSRSKRYTSAGTCDLQRDVLVLHRAPEQTALVREVTDLAPPDDPSRGDS